MESEEIPTRVQFSAKPETERWREFLSWCGHGDSNPDGSLHENLNLACLPISSCPQIRPYCTTPLPLPSITCHHMALFAIGWNDRASAQSVKTFTAKGVFHMEQTVSLCDLRPGQRGVVRALHSTGAMRRRLLDIGLVENTPVECLGRSPGGDPSAFLIRGAVIAIRRTDGRDVLLREG